MLQTSIHGLSHVTLHLNEILAHLGVILTTGAAIHGIKHLVESSFESIEATAKLSERLGITTEALGGLRFAADLAGVSGEEFAGLLEKMVKALGKMEVSGKSDALDKFGLSVTKLTEEAPDQAFLDVAEAMSKIESPTQRAALATQLFGKQGQAVLNVLMQGRHAIEEQIEEFRKLGGAYSNIDAARIEAAVEAWKKMNVVIGGIGNEIAITLAPAIEALAGNIGKSTDEFHGMKVVVREIANFGQDIGAFVLDIASVGKLIRGEAGMGTEWIRETERLRHEGLNRERRERGGISLDFEEKTHKTAAQSFLDNLQITVDTFGMAASAAELYKFSLQDVSDEEIERAKSLLAQQDILKAGREEEERLSKARIKDETEVAGIIEKFAQSPAEKLRSEFLRLQNLAFSGRITPEVEQRALEDLTSRVEKITGEKALTQSTAAIRAGSVEALRAQFSGQSPADKTAKNTEKIAAEEAKATALLTDIRDALKTGGLGDGSAL